MFASNTSAANGVANYIEDVFSTYLYTGNGSTQAINNGIDLWNKGGMVWIKDRTTANSHAIFDTARGAYNYLSSNTTDAQGYSTTTLSTFSSDGAGAPGFFVRSNVLVGTNGDKYASWTFRKQPKFFDVVTYTGTGSNRTISHNLGSAPGFMIVKCTSTTANWATYHRSLSGANYYMELNGVGVEQNDSTVWNATAPTSTVFSVGTSGLTNSNGQTYVAYLFAHNAGGFGLTGTDNVISCGSYTGTGSTGNVQTLGYEPQFLLIKNTSASGSWVMLDNMRKIVALPDTNADSVLYANTSAAEDSSSGVAYLTATGFGLKGGPTDSNASSNTYIYIAIRRGPMKVPTSGTSVFLPTASSAAQGTVITTGWPVDQQLIAVRAGNALNFRALSRLQGVSTTNTAGSTQYLSTASTSAESANSTAGRDWNNTGYDIPDVFNTTSCIYYAFQRAPNFMDVVCYTGTGTSTTTQVSHNLTVIPELIILKERNGATNWKVMCALNGSSSPNLRYGMELNTTITGYLDTAGAYQTYTTSAYFNPWLVGAGVPSTNTSGKTYVAYLFATCAGVSKVGSYTGTGTTKQVDCGFTGGARFVLIKRTDSTGDWYVWDSARGIVSGNDPYLLLNSTAAEVTSTDYVDTYSAGFEISSTAPAAINASGGTFIFFAVA